MAKSPVELFGESLLSAEGSVSTAEALGGKIIGIYFSAHWCPPCRGFTPQLAEWYKSSLSQKGFEVVFVSSDQDQAQFDEYFREMPWKALPFSDRQRKNALSKKYKVQGIPTFVILDDQGNLITTDGRSAVTNDPTGEDFPWRPKPFKEVLGASFLGQGGASLDSSAVDGKVLGLYFSAHWCPPCRGFTPQLAEWYKVVSPKHPGFQIVFISSDRSEEAFNEYFAEMPWIALPYAERKRKEALSTLFEVDGIPTFVIVDADGTVINGNGRAIPAMDPEGAQFPWHPEPVRDLAAGPDGLQENASLVVMLDGADEATKRNVKSALEIVAKECIDEAKESGQDPVLVFTGDAKSKQLLMRIRSLTKQPIIPEKHEHPLKEVPDRVNWSCDGCSGDGEGTAYSCAPCNFDLCASCNEKAVDQQEYPPSGVLLDLSDEGSFYLCDGVDFADTSSVRGFLQKYKEGKLDKLQA